MLDISKVKVEPITDYFEREFAGDLVSRHHPLGEKRLKGRRLVYSAKYKDDWLGVLFFDQSVNRNKHRESKIGWNDIQRKERLKHVVNNSRFVVLSGCAGIKNLASKILSLATNRLSSDWEERYGIPLLAVETYVDPAQNNNRGSCYEAAGWKNLGYSSGFEMVNGERTHSKWYYLKALHKDSYAALRADVPHALTTGVKSVSGKSNNNYVLDAAKLDLKGLQSALSKIPDPRKKHGQRYKFLPLLSLCVAAVLSGYTQYRQIADWISKLPPETRVKFGLGGDRVPTESTVAKFISKIDPEKLQAVLTDWLLKTYKKELKMEVLALDGKAITATGSSAGKQVKHLNVFASELGIVINQVPTKGGSGENKTAQKVVKNDANLSNKIILADAIHTEKEFIKEVQKKTLRTSSLSKVIRQS